MGAWREELYHYAKGSTAKDHKYIRKEGNRYIYAEPKGGTNKSGIGDWFNGVSSQVSSAVSNIGYALHNTLHPEDKQRLQELEAEHAKIEENLRNAVIAVMKDWEKGEYKDSKGPVYFDKNRLSDPALVAANMEKAYYWKIYANEKMQKAAKYAAELRDNEKEQQELREVVGHADCYSPELYHTAIGGTLIITRR